MSLSPPVAERLADSLQRELEAAGPGHCVRVDYLSETDAVALCAYLRDRLSTNGASAFVLHPSERDGQLYISPERAIEIRNRKQVKLCLVVPSGLVDAAASSLANYFAVFDLEQCLRTITHELMRQLPEDVRIAARRALGIMRRPLNPAPEQVADYLGVVLENPSLERVGLELWRIGLLPDAGGEGLVDRVEANYRCMRKLVRPIRAQSSPAERLEEIGLRKGAVRDELLKFLRDKRLRDVRTWLPDIAAEPLRGRLTFERWAFESAGFSNLERIEVEPLLDKEGKVEKYTRLQQPGGPGSQPVAAVGPKSKVTVKWDAVPPSPTNLKRWRAELIPSPEEYAEEETLGLDLPSVKVIAKTRRASIPLHDIDLENISVRAVCVRVLALDEHDIELRDAENKVIEGLSGEFWLSQEEASTAETRVKRDTVPTLPFARLKAALELPVESIEEAPGQWSERDLHYYSITLNGRRTSRIGLSPILRNLEERCIQHPETGGRYVARVDVAMTLDATGIETSGPGEIFENKAGSKFLDRRKDLFRALESQHPRGLIETADWTNELSKRARAYASAYRELLANATSRSTLTAALTLDTLQLDVEHPHGVEHAVLILPTHPLRILWYAAYTDLLRSWEESLLKIEKQRGHLLDLDLVERVAPLNCPTFVVSEDGNPFLFTQNLRLFWGLALPVDAADPARRVGDIATVIGLQETEASLADLPPRRLADELRAYSEVHPYLETLRLNVINPGSGSFVADALRLRYEAPLTSDEEDSPVAPPPRIELIAHAHKPVPQSLPPFAELLRAMYESQPRGRRHHHLAPLFAMAIRPMERADYMPGGDVNLSVAVDQLRPVIVPVKPQQHEDSGSFYGLLVRLLPRFIPGEAMSHWEHRLSFPAEGTRERHPVFGPYTNDLVDTHREYLQAVSRIIDRDSKERLPAVSVQLSPEDRLRVGMIHHQSDWVVTLDRFFGVEYYDDPGDSSLAGVAQKYLLDYCPEFLEGLGHRMLVTTSHREEVEEILSRAMRELGFGMVEQSVGEVLAQLKTISGRLALRILGDDARAREAVSLGVVAAYLRARGELNDSILIPVDAHPELFGPKPKRQRDAPPQARCDLVRIQFLRNRLAATFIEVKSRAATSQSDELLHRIVDQIEATENVFRGLFFQKDPPRLDHVLQRSRLVTILRFYLGRAWRHGLISSRERLVELEASIGRLESGIPDLRAERWGFVVNIPGKPQRKIRLRDTEIYFLTASDVAEAGLSVSNYRPESISEPTEPKKPEKPQVTVQPITPQRPDQSVKPEKREDIEKPKDEEPTSDDIQIELGVTEGGQTPVLWQPSVRGSPHLFILGIPGQGKSVTVTRLLVDLAALDIPSLVIDFHGQFGDANGPYTRAASPTVLDAAKGLPFSPFEAELSQQAGTNFWMTNCFTVAEIFQYVCELGDIQRDVVYEALRDCYRDVGFEEGNVERLPSIREVQKRLEELANERGIKNVLPRCRPLLELGLFAETPETHTEFRHLLGKGLVLDVHSLGLETLQLAAGAFVLRKIYKDMFRWGEADRLRLVIVLDEAHRLARDVTLPKIMKEGRKFGVAVVVASQGLADFHPDIVGNAGTKIVFRTNFPMSKKVSGFLRTRKGFDLAAAIEQLDVGEAYVHTPEMANAARVRMHPLRE